MRGGVAVSPPKQTAMATRAARAAAVILFMPAV